MLAGFDLNVILPLTLCLIFLLLFAPCSNFKFPFITVLGMALSAPVGDHWPVAAALAIGMGTDTQRPFTLVIISGLITRLVISIFLMPAFYAIVVRPKDRLEV